LLILFNRGDFGMAVRFFGNVLTFAVLYVLFLIPTYVLPWAGSNSLMFAAASSEFEGQIPPAFWGHLGALGVLVLLAFCRGRLIGKAWLPVLPVIAGLFDLMPGLSMVPFVPTAFHVVTLVLGVMGGNALASSPETQP